MSDWQSTDPRVKLAVAYGAIGLVVVVLTVLTPPALAVAAARYVWTRRARG